MSTEHNCPVVRIGEITQHPNADTLSITQVDGRPVIIRTGEYQPGDLAIYVPIDSLCPVDDPRFAFLAQKHRLNVDGKARLRAARLRGVFSMGLLVRFEGDTLSSGAVDLLTGSAHGHQFKPDAVLGQDMREHLRIDIWEPQEFGLAPDAEPDPGFLPVYDIESARKWAPVVLEEGEEVVICEKIHGANSRFAWHGVRGGEPRLWCGSRTRFPRKAPGDLWWSVAERESLEERLSRFPGIAIYGEVYGQVQDLRYGEKGAGLVAFDAYDIASKTWLDYDAFWDITGQMGLARVPILYRGAWLPALAGFAEGDSLLAEYNGAKHVREGWVLRPVRERQHPGLGRVILKRHGEGFLTRKEG